MKYIFTITLLTGFLTSSGQIAIGDELPHQDLDLTLTDGTVSKLGELRGENGLLIVFSANKCIAVKYWYDRLIESGRLAQDNGINVVWVNSNQTQRSDGESLADMKAFSVEKELPFNYYQEQDFTLADNFKTEVTPTNYLFDRDLKLVYKGIVDDNMMDASKVKEQHLVDALKETIAGKKVKNPVVMGRGCRIPRT